MMAAEGGVERVNERLHAVVADDVNAPVGQHMAGLRGHADLAD